MIIPIICIIINILWSLYTGYLDYYDGFFPQRGTEFNFSSPELWIIFLNILFFILLIKFREKLKNKEAKIFIGIWSILITIFVISIDVIYVNR